MYLYCRIGYETTTLVRTVYFYLKTKKYFFLKSRSRE